MYVNEPICALWKKNMDFCFQSVSKKIQLITCLGVVWCQMCSKQKMFMEYHTPYGIFQGKQSEIQPVCLLVKKLIIRRWIAIWLLTREYECDFAKRKCMRFFKLKILPVTWVSYGLVEMCVPSLQAWLNLYQIKCLMQLKQLFLMQIMLYFTLLPIWFLQRQLQALMSSATESF